VQGSDQYANYIFGKNWHIIRAYNSEIMYFISRISPLRTLTVDQALESVGGKGEREGGKEEGYLLNEPVIYVYEMKHNDKMKKLNKKKYSKHFCF
jgi:hypothetical protein